MLPLAILLAVASPTRDDLSAMYAEMHALRDAYIEYETEHGQRPTLAELAGGAPPTDAWGAPYSLAANGHVRSRGANGIDENGLGDDWGTDLAPRADIDHPSDTNRFVLLGVGVAALAVIFWILKAMARTGYQSRDVGGSI